MLGALTVAAATISISTPATVGTTGACDTARRTVVSPTGASLVATHLRRWTPHPSAETPDGSISYKAPWYGSGPNARPRAAPRGPLAISGRRLDASAGPLRAHTRQISVATRRGSAWAVELVFPSLGCWSVVGRVGRTTLSFRILLEAPDTAPAVAGPDGAEGCAPPSPARRWWPQGPSLVEARGSGDHELWAMLFDGQWASPSAAVFTRDPTRTFKIAWAMGGEGPLRLVATSPAGETVPPLSGPTPHASNWMRPGDEWGSVFRFAEDGCWRIRATRDSGSADLWLVVSSRPS